MTSITLKNCKYNKKIATIHKKIKVLLQNMTSTTQKLQVQQKKIVVLAKK